MYLRIPIFSLALLFLGMLSPDLPAQKRAPGIDLPRAPFPYSDPTLAPVFDRSQLDQNTPWFNKVSDQGATLGRVLFYDTRLSRNQRVSCASCHKQSRAFADRTRRSKGFRGRRTKRNSMALTNLAYYKNGRFFWDERAGSLEEMVLMPIQDEIEMGMDLDTLVDRLKKVAAYRHLFKWVYGDPEITANRIAKSLAQFLRSMVSFQSRFDKGYAQAGSLSVDFENFTKLENLGKRVFLGIEHGNARNSCASCHLVTKERIEVNHCAPRPSQVTRGYGEMIPALFVGTRPRNNGIDRGKKKEDPGLAGQSKQSRDRGLFKIPSLRNVELTGPYMHDGRFASLSQVVEHYSKRVQAHPNLDPALRGNSQGGWGQRSPRVAPTTVSMSFRLVSGTSPSKSTPIQAGQFRFTIQEKRALVAFLKTLTDRKFIKDPRFSDPFR